MTSHIALIVFLVLNAFFNGVMAWIWTPYTVRAFIFFKAIPALLSLSSIVYLLSVLGFIVSAR